MPSTEKQLRSLYGQLVAKEKIEIHLKNLDRLLLMEEEALVEAEKVLEKEEADVVKLEKKSLYTIFRTILGNKEQELEKERQEYLQAFLKKQSISACILGMKKEKEALLHSYSGKFNVEKEFDRLFDKLKKDIKKEKPGLAAQIFLFEDRIARHYSRIKELKQGKRDGGKVIRALKQILMSLENIQSWGGDYSTLIVRKKQVAAGKMRTKIIRTQKSLQAFENELFDLTDHYGHDYRKQIEEIRNFLDLFLDSLIMDWIVKKRIEHSANVVSNLIDKVTLIVAMLENDMKKTETYIEQERKDQRRVIVEYKSN